MRAAILSLVLLLPALAPTSVAERPLAALVEASELVVIARVLSVREQDGVRLAEAQVERVLGGSFAGPTLTFRASPDWTCDLSDAVPGERALLLLQREADGARLRLTHHGRGRFPLGSDGAAEAALVHGVTLPRELAARPAAAGDVEGFPSVAPLLRWLSPAQLSTPRWGFSVVRLDALEAYVRGLAVRRRAASPRARSSR